ncbi:MAG: SDR family oxidoreductase [Planctomycetales bacterium]|nr:SDR family oxidoreductase [Planctomycetales bacterium]
MDLQLNDRVALLVGGRGTMGQALCRALKGEGAIPVVADLPGPAMPEASAVVDLDVTQSESVAEAFAQTLRQFGRIDVLVTLAGVYQGGPAAQLSADDWQRLLAINLTGTFLACREALPIMQRQDYGRIICVASLAGQVGGVVAGANYSASKAGVLSLVKSLARQSEKPWITVNAISPGPVDGSMTDAWPDEQRDRVRDSIPLKRFATADEVASLAIFLASPRAAYIHGARIDLNGGLFMG